jgi:hypothetical protein
MYVAFWGAGIHVCMCEHMRGGQYSYVGHWSSASVRRWGPANIGRTAVSRTSDPHDCPIRTTDTSSRRRPPAPRLPYWVPPGGCRLLASTALQLQLRSEWSVQSFVSPSCRVGTPGWLH